ncbi:hypothetical protein FRC09_001298 [Ceratobasidium sp. 395]|nr:hypothetical protein FRC09_001298 [Ceratobasidium sp. 395]
MCPDIISTVFANLDQSDLARALRVCRQWNEWSDTLWESLPTLSPLLRLTCPFVFTDRDGKYVSSAPVRVITVSNPSKPNKIQSVPLYQIDRVRFAHLAKLVRRIDASNTPSDTLFNDFNPNIPGHLQDICEPDSSLFPRLQSLRTQCRNDAELFGVVPLLGSSLRSLEISIHHSAIDFMLELLTGIQGRATKLERLDISCQPCTVKRPHSEDPTQREFDSYVYIPPIGCVLLELSSTLKALNIPSSCMSPDTFLALAHLPLLESLSFSGSWCSEVHGDEWPDLDQDPNSFPALSHLSLPCSISAATSLLTAIPDSVSISHVQIKAPHSSSDEDMLELCAKLARFRMSLRRVGLEQPQHINEASILKWGAAFGPLLTCDGLEELVIDMAIDISDADAQRVASRLSGIELLRLPACLLSSSALRHISNLRHLRELDITTDAFERPATQLESNLFKPSSRPSHGTLRLNVGASPVQSPASAIDVIRELFPHQKVIELAWTTESGGGERDVYLGEVRELLRH